LDNREELWKKKFMGRKTQRTKQHAMQRTKQPARSLASQAQQIEAVNELTANKQWAEAIAEVQRLRQAYSFDPEPLTILIGTSVTAYVALYDYQKAYEALTEILGIRPDDGEMYFYRSVIAKQTGRVGQSARDMATAYALLKETGNPKLVRETQKKMKVCAKDALKAARRRGPHFTVDQLIEQEEAYLQAIQLTYDNKWVEAEHLFRHVIEMAEKDFDARPWSNVGTCLMEQGRYDEAEEALKRALKINRFYRLARNNLHALTALRRGEKVANGRYVDVYEDNK
jgi:tetratricopeptide (TPR) repeat protein